MQLLYLCLGILAFILSNFLIGQVLREIILISSWVLIWNMIETEFFQEVNTRKRKKALYRLVNCDIIVYN